MTDTTPEAVERLIGPGAEAMPDGERLTALGQMCRALSAEVQRLTSHHYTGSRVEDAITAHWGSRCYDFAEGCSCCEAWAEYDRLTAAAQTPPEDVGPDHYDRGRRDMLNAILALNPAADALCAEMHGRTPDPHGKLPFDVLLWVTIVAEQLGIEPKVDPLAKQGGVE